MAKNPPGNGEWKEQPDDFWRKRLTPEAFTVTRKEGTEAPFSGAYHDYKGAGRFVCVCCGTPLFDAAAKFDSGTGWPSFFDVIEGSCETREDRKIWTSRTEVHCATCGAHMGHIFGDGPKPTGLRYCINSVSIELLDGKERAAE